MNSNQKTNICSIGGATVGAPGDDLEQIVSELRDRLTPDQYQQLVKKLLGNGRALLFSARIERGAEKGFTHPSGGGQFFELCRRQYL